MAVNRQAIDAIQAYQKNPDASEVSQAVEADLSWLAQANNTIIALPDPAYPAQLKQISLPPLVMYIIGDPDVLQHTQIAMVGSRNPSVVGRDTARSFAKQLAMAGITVTSGLAIGIDGVSHEGALAGSGQTVAVMATGADKRYPRHHIQLAEKITQHGALVTEFPLGTPPRPGHFPQRNRIISGLSLGTLVVEAAPKSGSLITARFALNQDREVFAIPGSIHNPMSKGCHALIRQGAKLVETIDDILEEISYMMPDSSTLTNLAEPTNLARVDLDPSVAQVFKLIGYDVVSHDQLMVNGELSAAELTANLIQLELLDCIKAVDGGFVRNLSRK
jgi:DNA processing protein